MQGVIPNYSGVRLGLLDEVYPAGDEVVLIYEVTGKVVRPGGLPIESGVIVFNVETLYNLSRAMHKSEPVVDKLVSVVAEVNRPVTLRMPLGATVEDAVRLAGRRENQKSRLFRGRSHDGQHHARVYAHYQDDECDPCASRKSLSCRAQAGETRDHVEKGSGKLLPVQYVYGSLPPPYARASHSAASLYARGDLQGRAGSFDFRRYVLLLLVRAVRTVFLFPGTFSQKR